MLSCLVLIPGIGAVVSLLLESYRLVGLVSSLLCFAASLLVLVLFDSGLPGYQLVQECTPLGLVSLYLGVDGISLCFVVLTTTLVPVALLSGWASCPHPMYTSLILLLESLLLLVFLVNDIFYFYVFFESILPSIFILIEVFGAADRRKAGLYIFLYTLAGSFFLLLSIVYVVMVSGTADLTLLGGIDLDFSSQMLILLGAGLAFAVKAPIVLLHPWLLRAHVESPLGGSVLLAGVVLKLGLYGIMIIVLPLCPFAYDSATPAIYTIAVVSIVYASLSTLRSIDVKELVAYSSIAHAGVYSAAVLSGSLLGLEGSVLLGVAHGLVSPGMFICVGGVLYDRTSTRLLPLYRGMAQSTPILAILLFGLCLGNSGVPLTLNFLGEFLSLAGVFERSIFACLLSSTSMVLASAFTMLLFNRAMTGGAYSPYMGMAVTDVNLREFSLLYPLVAMTLILGVYSSPITTLVGFSSTSLLSC